MKNFKTFSLLVIWFSLLFGGVSADAQCINLGDNHVCVDVEKQWNTYYVSNDVSCRNGDCGLWCDAEIANTTITNVGGCNGSFRYNWNWTNSLKINIMMNGIYGQIDGRYNYNGGYWVSSSSNSSENRDDDYRYDDDDRDYYNDYLNISASSSSLSTSQFARVTIDTDDDYVGRVNFSLKYRSSTSSSWSSVSRTSSTYVSDYSSVWSNGYYNMTYSDNGQRTLSNLVKFKKAGYYRIVVEDQDNNYDYVDIHVSGNGGSYDNNTLNISASSSSLSTSQFARVTIDTDDDYVGRVNFSLKYRSSTSSSWSSVSRTSSTYVSDYSSVWSNGYYNMTYSDNGQRTLSNLVKFKKAGYYRIVVEDQDNNYDYVDIHVSGNGGSYDNNTLNISASSSSLSTSQFARVTIDTDDDYVGRVNFSLKYRSSTSSSWSSVSRTSSTYVSDYSSVWSNGYYSMTYSDNGQKTLSNLVKFKKVGYYRIVAEDSDGNEDYVDIHVSGNGGSYDNNTLNISASSSSLSTSQFARITIDTDDDYVGRVNFSLKYRSSTSSSWTSITRTSSTYVSDYSSVWSNGYYNMTYSDYGQRTLSNLVKFKKAGYYRIVAEDSDGNEDYVDIHVSGNGGSNYDTVDGFTEDEFEMVRRIYNVFPSLIAQLKLEHPVLKSNSSRNNLTNTFYENTKDVINDVYGRKFSTYDEFFSDFKVRYNRTINLIK